MIKGAQATLLFHPRLSKILKYIKANGTVTTPILQKELGIEHPFGGFYMTRLMQFGLVVDDGWVETLMDDGRLAVYKRYKLTPNFDEILNEAQKMIEELR